MPAIEDLLVLERPSQRLGVLWRSQGQEFLDATATELLEDVERLRDAYISMAAAAAASQPAPRRRLRVPRVIDLREPASDPDVSAHACSTDGHGDVVALCRCSRCHDVYCRNCILQSAATHDKPLCTECALIVAGVHHKRARPLVAHARARS
jgi:hypothetical protein